MSDVAGLRKGALAAPAAVALLAFAAAATATYLFEDAYRELNRPEPDGDGARLRLLACAVLAGAGLVAGGVVLGRGAPWMLLPGAAGIFLLFDRIEDAWGRWGMNWEEGIILWPAVWLLGVLVLVALTAVRRSLGAAAAAKGAIHAAAVVLLPLLLFSVSFVANLTTLERTADEQWTSEHADPPPLFWAIAMAVLAAAAWARRRR